MKKISLIFCTLLAGLVFAACTSGAGQSAPASTPQAVAKLSTYINTGYGYRFNYPRDLTPVSNDEAISDVQKTPYMHLDGTPSKFKMFKLYATIFEVYVISPDLNGELQNYVKTIHDGQKGSKTPMVEITVGGEKGYTFTVNETFNDDYGAEIIQEEHTVVYVSHGEHLYRLFFGKNLPESQEILKSFAFSK